MIRFGRVRCISTVAIFMLWVASNANAALIATFRQVATNQTTNPIIMLLPFDVWALDLENRGSAPVDALEIHLQGSNFLQQGGKAYRPNTELPVLFGFSAPDTFFVTRPTIDDSNVLIAPGTLIDTSTNFDVAYTVAGGPSLLDAGEKRTIAVVSVGNGIQLGPSNIVEIKAAINGAIETACVEFCLVPPTVDDAVVYRPLGPLPGVLTTTLPVSDDGPLGELTWTLESFTSDGPIVNQPTVDPATGEFSWVHLDSRPASTYTAVIRATDRAGLSDTGVLTIPGVPEPGGIIAAMLAIVSMLACGPRLRVTA